MTTGTDIDLVDPRTGTAAPGGSTALRGYLAVPDGDGPWPGVVVMFEAFGLDDVMRRHADRLAGMGFLAVIPDLYSDGGARRCLRSTFRALGAGEGRPFVDIETARRWLLQRDDCTGRVGCVGFCMGGGFALVAASRGFDAASANYGMPPKDLDATMADACPVVGSYGGKDRMLKGTAAKLEVALSTAGVAHDIKEYPKAGHSFLNDGWNGPTLIRPLLRLSGAGPEPESARDAWHRIGTFFDAHLRAPST
jgi:carboxymethylenebutenolidase